MRKPGWYWVRWNERCPWFPSWWDGTCFRYDDEFYTEREVHEIDETPIDRDKILAVVEAAQNAEDLIYEEVYEDAEKTEGLSSALLLAADDIHNAIAAYHGIGEDANEVPDV